jgi:hypothetical protein
LKRLIVGLLSVVALAFAGPAAADTPTPFSFTDVFPDINPCTGGPMTVTLMATGFFHEHGSREVAHGMRTITTSDGFAGRGTESFVNNGRILKFSFADMMTNASGDRFRANGVVVIDVATDTARVERFALTCLTK